ncbi:Glycosyltransferase, catalytic subunit of cellulose synthase and poly-beta-1,6-N-acetylglucosamine synthase [Lutibacter oricola]|uniref:Glycosyltransferase, catalytic subunit of cellulose synthase and poly-beta-1,6-N-acetylglucosamine synthase n=1 Tax=Lutibacter oricola TaxID=762486 RepID=A0A1H3AQY7_9FLAO|nr:glycosyltransferase [Lutibacter oricola]SDX32087.1 Glycosyltransferase, catalytic subunit of cellulose synthase and poly-beta-1,6-N-acetylglucosamine synthase [Lutibacter oricola]
MLPYLLGAFICICSIQILYYLFIFSQFAFRKKVNSQKESTLPISVIVCAKNEEKNLENLLILLEEQVYSNFELVLVNDCSTDATLAIFEVFKKRTNISTKIVNVQPNEQFWGSKKYALTLGIKATSNEHLLFTDADCKPINVNWISEMTANFSDEKQLVLGYGSYQKISNSILNKLIRFETLLTAIQYFSYAKIGIPYMGVGRNIAYTKSLFFSTNGFVNHMKIKSGDDDLFVNEAATKKNTAICFSENSFTSSTPKKKITSWIQQKRRHVSTAEHYKKKHQFLLGLFYSSQFLFWLLAILLVSLLYNWQLVALLITIRFIAQYLIIGFSAKKLNEKDLIVFTPIFELFLILIQMFIFIKNRISKPTHW